MPVGFHGVVFNRTSLGKSVFAALALVLGCAGGMPSIPSTPEAILQKADQYFEAEKYFQSAELYRSFLSRHPGHDRSDYAQFRLAESYRMDEQYPLAAVEYLIVISDYGYSEYTDDALFNMGVCFYEESPDPKRDQQRTRDALSRFEQFVKTYPNSPMIDQAHAYIAELESKLAKKYLAAGKFYLRKKKPKSAMIYFDKVIEEFPDNPFWAEALYHKAVILLDRGETDDAIRYLSQVLDYPDDLDFKDDARRRMTELRQ